MIKSTFFRFSRLVLLSGIVVCLILPFINVTIEKETLYQKPVAVVENYFLQYDPPKESVNKNKSIIKPNQILNDNQNKINTENRAQSPFIIILSIYMIGVLFMLIRLIRSIIELRKIIQRGEIKHEENCTITIVDEDITAFSFFNHIIISQSDYIENHQEIIAHENEHRRNGHSIDIFFIEMLLIFQWFNIGLWSLRNDLREIHEYEADSGVIKKGIEIKRYQLLLVKKAVGKRCFTSVVNSFNHSLIKNRITMMLKKKSNPWARLKVLLMLPLAVGMLYAFAEPAINETMETMEKQVSQAIKQVIDVDDPTFLWDEVNNYCKANNIAMKDFYEVAERSNPTRLLINQEGELQVKDESSNLGYELQNKEFKIDKSNNHKDLVAHFEKLIHKKYREKPCFFYVEHEYYLTTSKAFTVLDALIEAYNNSINKIAKEKNKSVKDIRSEMPLLAYFGYYSFKVPPPPPPPPSKATIAMWEKNGYPKNKINWKNKVSIHSIDKERKVITFPFKENNVNRKLTSSMKRYNNKSLDYTLVYINPSINKNNLKEIESSINQYKSKGIKYLYADFENHFSKNKK